VGAPSFQ